MDNKSSNKSNQSINNKNAKNDVKNDTPVNNTGIKNNVALNNNLKSSINNNKSGVGNNVSGVGNNVSASGKNNISASGKNNGSVSEKNNGSASGKNNVSASGKNNVSASGKNNVSLTQQEEGILNRLNSILNNADKPSFFNSYLGKSSSNKSSSSNTSISNKSGNSIGNSIGNDIGSGIDNGESIVVNTDNYIIILGVFFALVLLVLLYFLSKTFNVGRTLERMKMFERYQKITNFANRMNGNANVILKDVIISSSYNSCHSGNQMFGYTSENVLKQVLKSGCRYVELNVFASVYGDKAIPVVSQGYKQGQWKLMLNTTNFEDCINVIAKNAFSIINKEGGSPNPNDPLFLGLNLSTGYNLSCLDLMHDIILDYLSDYLLDSKYAYQFNNHLHSIPVKELQNKVIIFASTGYEGSNMEELINCQWEDETNILDNPNINLPSQNNAVEMFSNMDEYQKTVDKNMKVEKRINAKKKKPFTFDDSLKYSDITKGKTTAKNKLDKFYKKLKDEFGDVLDNSKGKENMEDVNPLDVLSTDGDHQNKTKLLRISSEAIMHPAFNASRVKQHNRQGLTIVVPHIEGDFFTNNYNPNMAFDLGCQFVAMNYQLVDEDMDKYITKFEKFGILEK